jgi:hypothetical protein
LGLALSAAAPPHAPFTTQTVLFTDDFRGGLGQWAAEVEKPGRVEARDGMLSADVPAGCTLWFRPELEGAVMIEYDARMVRNGGANDRVSDLNAFWMATDARSPGDLFATRRSGKFADYNQLRTYYVGQGGNGNTTTRFRRYIGSADERPLLAEHDLRTPDVLLTANAWQRVQLVAMGKRIQYYRDGRLLFDFNDPAPYTRGRFGFRTTFSHVELRNFRVYRIVPTAPVSARSRLGRMTGYHIAQVNIGRVKGPMDSAIMHGFASLLEEINALADGAPGFVWRLQGASGNATKLRPYAGDDALLINMSVWETVEALRHYVYRTAHAELLRDRQLWFEKLAGVYTALWWVPAGHIPTIEEAKERLAHLEAHGPTEYAFTFQKVFATEQAAGA